MLAVPARMAAARTAAQDLRRCADSILVGAASPCSPVRGVHVARQPIFNASQRIAGYELLYRGTSDSNGADDAGDLASARVVTDTLLLLGLEALTQGHPAFVNATRRFLLGDFANLLPAAGTVLEVLETIHVDDEVVSACRRLKAAGYALALDDYVPGTSADALVPYVKFVKVDVLQTPAADWAAIRRDMPRHVTLLAEKIENVEVLEEARACGFELFQGYYYCKPQTFSSSAPPLQQLANARLLAGLYRSGATVHQIEDLIKTDVSLTYYVLRSINSAAFAVRREIRSIGQALVLLGLEQVRRWASVWALTGTGRSSSSQLVLTALVRARCCEHLFSDRSDVEPSECFLLGLCSLLDVMLGCPMGEIAASLPLSEQVRRSLLGEPTRLRTALDAVIAYEQGHWDAAAGLAATLSVSEEDLRRAYAEALVWTQKLQLDGQ